MNICAEKVDDRIAFRVDGKSKNFLEVWYLIKDYHKSVKDATQELMLLYSSKKIVLG